MTKHQIYFLEGLFDQIHDFLAPSPKYSFNGFE